MNSDSTGGCTYTEANAMVKFTVMFIHVDVYTIFDMYHITPMVCTTGKGITSSSSCKYARDAILHKL